MMVALRDVGCSVGEYVGEMMVILREWKITDVDHGKQNLDDDDDSGSTNDGNSHPLLVLYDGETTRLVVYADHITKVLNPPVPLPTTFSSLVRSGCNISIACIQMDLQHRNTVILQFLGYQ